MALTRKDIRLTYIGTLNRAPEPGAVDWWFENQHKGVVDTPSKLFRTFRESEEGLGKFPQKGTLDNRTYYENVVKRLYLNFFNRSYTDGTISEGTVSDYEIAYWVDDIENVNSAVTIDSILIAIATVALSPKHKGNYQDYLNSKLEGATPEETEVINNAITDSYDWIKAQTDADHINNKENVAAMMDAIKEPNYAPSYTVSTDGQFTFSNSNYNISVLAAYDMSNIDNTQESVDTFIKEVADEEVNYAVEYVAAYNTIVDKTLNSNNAPLKMLMDMVDSAPNSEVSVKEKLSIKKNALMQLLSNVTMSAQQTAMQLVDKKYKFKDELASSEYNVAKARADANMVIAQRKALEDQVVDNRRIRAMDSLGDTYGTMMAGGLVPNESMWAEYFRLSKELTRNTLESDKLKIFIGTWRPSSKNGLIEGLTSKYVYNNIYTDTTSCVVTFGDKGTDKSTWTIVDSSNYTLSDTYDYDFDALSLPTDGTTTTTTVATTIIFNQAWFDANSSGKDFAVSSSLNDYLPWQEPASLVGGGKIIRKGQTLSVNDRNEVNLNVPGAYYIVDLSDWYVDTPFYPKWEGGSAYSYGTIVRYNGKTYSSLETANTASPTDTNKWLEIISSQTNIAKTLADISVDGINYWKHGDIIYVDSVNDSEADNTRVLYRRMSGYSAGSSVKVAPANIEDTNDSAGL